MSDGKDVESSIDSILRAVARAPAEPSVAVGPGDRVGGFVLEEVLGQGATGVVYRARDETLGRSVALKILRRSDDGHRRRFAAEARVLAAMRHPGLATIYEVGDADGVAFIAMELVEGESLRQRLRGGRLARGEALDVIKAVCDAVAVAHARGIAHRDLKPENVLVAHDGSIRVVDFGLAKSVDVVDASRDVATEMGQIVGTPGYMAPEQLAGRLAGARSDVFALGVLLYELLTGERPFRGNTTHEIATATSRDRPAPARRFGVERKYEAVIERCLAKNPDARFADAAEVRRALDGAGSRPSRLSIVVGLVAAAALGLVVAFARAPQDTAPSLRSSGSTPAATTAVPPAPVASSAVVPERVAPAASSARPRPLVAPSAVRSAGSGEAPPAAPQPPPINPLEDQK